MHWLSTQLKTGEHFVKKLLSQTVLHSLRHSLHHWRVGLRVSKTSLLDDGLQALSAFRWIDSPRGHFYADPMLFGHEGRIWLFVEDYLHATNRAQTILAAEVSEDGSVDGFMPVLTRPYHVSYPLVFRHKDDIYMLPETAEHHTIELYRSVRFPFQWRLHKVLFDHAGYDTTPLEFEGRWYFFTTLPEQGTRDGYTHVFMADNLAGPWEPHPVSPLYPPGKGRGAGPIIRVDGRLIRPTQCGIPVYGYSFSLDEIIQLDPTRIVHQRLATFEPTWSRHLRGTHTYGRVGQIEVIDSCWGVNPYDVM
jgi:hypothetical protein